MLASLSYSYKSKTESDKSSSPLSSRYSSQKLIGSANDSISGSESFTCALLPLSLSPWYS